MSNYILQETKKSFCPNCSEEVDLLIPFVPLPELAIFYICWECKKIFQAGVGEVQNVRD